ncbi:Low temperature requirement protein A [Streptococcus sp. DD11]|uniref:low temperature requirement protein A n=1 Tax=Streptococcus sp. DD11 TaxID=1777879 RepID=UPI000798C72E|nr:low temperature requirement protein A [Streptococcus sp. DD11]KXT85315.1 Low temperature requirement protein A [Streptococcus sp. DD11]
MSLIKHKKVELTELFYDLVYVYTISQLTSIIHHAHHGVLSLQSLSSFLIGLIIFVNSWMVQTVYTNRFGSNSLRNIVFMFLQMICLLVSSRAVAGDWQENFVWIVLPVALISSLLLIQYIVEYVLADKASDRSLIRQFFYILGLRSASLFLALLFPYHIGLWVAVIGILVTWILPGFLNNPNRGFVSADLSPINFPHLIERLSLLVIITFGEMLIGISEHFSSEAFSLLSVLIFLIVTNLFMIYIVEIDHLLDVNREEMGIRAIYLHYPIFFGLSFITVSLSFFGNSEMNLFFSTIYFYAGLALFMSGLLPHNPYNKLERRFSMRFLLIETALPILGLAASLIFFSAHALATVGLAFLVTAAMMAYFVRFNLTGKA